jgi:DMSO/TMAO reductase YedYZ molybdopterin-dependent catalytic subunit
MDRYRSDPVYRRQFLSTAASVAGLAGQKRPDLLLPSDTPDEHKFRLMWYNPVPPIDVSSWKLKIFGLVEKPLALSLPELRRMPQDSLESRMKCVQCWSARALWGGVRFGHVMELAKPARGAKAVRIDCADKWFEYFSIEDVLSPRVLLVLDMAGKPLSPAHGAPLRLIDPGRYGYKSAKLITSIQFVTEGKGSMACDIGPYYSPDGLIQAGYDQPLDLGGPRRRIRGGEITDY